MNTMKIKNFQAFKLCLFRCKKIKSLNKKGFLLAEETLKIVIALIAITFLIYFLTSLYFANQNSRELEQAEASLEFLIKEINDGREEVLIYNPEGWVLISWPYQDEDKFPNSCNKKSCICIVDDVNLVSQAWSALTSDARQPFLEKSSDIKKAICMENIKNLIVKRDGTQQQPILIQPPLTLNIKDNIIKITKK